MSPFSTINRRRRSQRILRVGALATVSGTALSLSLALSGNALAQSAQAQTAQTPVVEEIVVTGSRIVRQGFEAPTPTTIVGIETINESAPATIADFVNSLPEFGAGQTTHIASSGGVSGGVKGTNTLNLRGLGGNRNLILMDGTRVAANNLDNSVDVSGFPDALISRVDVVTGGASAAYGSDALSGVVNFVLDKDYTGFKGTVQGGLTTYGDDRSFKISLTGGIPFNNDRGHILIDLEDGYVPGILNTVPRAWAHSGYQIMVNPAYGTTTGLSTSVPNYIVGPAIALSNASPGGMITAGPLKGTAFGPGGVPFKLNYGSLLVDPQMQGGDWAYTDTGFVGNLDERDAKKNAFFRFSYDLTDDIKAYVQGSYGNSDNLTTGNNQGNFGNVVIKADNAFIPASIAAQMTALKLTTITVGSMNVDTPPLTLHSRRSQYRYVAGASGKIDAFDTPWKWDAYYQKGIARSTITLLSMNQSFFNSAVDAVRSPTTGAIVCRSNLTGANPACVPYNLFGEGVNTQAVLNYLLGLPQLSQKVDQSVESLSASGEPFSDWAGPISMSLGVEHRKESVSGWNDDIGGNKGYFAGNYLATNGSYSVTEGFVEVVVPLAKETVWAKTFDLNAAARGTSYSTSGYVTTWKVGATYNPIDDIRFRATRSRDIRAPNLGELFATGTRGTGPVLDPFRNGIQTTSVNTTIGNPNLKPEEADTTGLGVVLQPTFFPGFNASVDFYNIVIGNSISSIGGQAEIDRCFLGQQNFCAQITRAAPTPGNPLGDIIATTALPVNFVDTRTRGYDIEASYTAHLGTWADSLNGDLTLRALATHVLFLRTNDGVNPVTEAVGSNAGNGPVHWRYRLSASYSLDPINIGLTARGISAGVYNTAYVSCASGCPVSTTLNRTISNNNIPGAWYYDLSLNYKLMNKRESGTDIEFFLNIQNLMNTDPVPVGHGPGGNAYIAAPANALFYDTLGRQFRAGIRFGM